jgi:hygromycin-B 7''-O-kinase
MIVRKYYQREAPDPVLTPEHVLRLARRHVPTARELTGIDETGGEARVYYLDNTIVLKVQRPQQLRSWTSLEKEVVFLRHLAAVDPALSVPRVLGYGRAGTVEYTVMTRMPGEAAVRANIPPAVRPETLRELGRAIRRVHAVNQAPLRESGLFPEEYTADDLRVVLPRDVGDMARRLRDRGGEWPFSLGADDLAAKLVERIPPDPPGLALHTNPGPMHTFVDPATGGYSGLIDFGDAYIGHPAVDLVRWPDPEDRRFVLAGYLDDGDPGPGFWSYYPVAAIMADLLVMVRRPDRWEEMRRDVEQHLAEW